MAPSSFRCLTVSSNSCIASGRPLTAVRSAVRAFDLQRRHIVTVRSLVTARLEEAGLPGQEAASIAEDWITHSDFLRAWHEPRSVDFVVGNPPYIRPEDLAPELLAEYRATCRTMSGRADIYIGFFEFGLRLLNEGGVLGFICADRWMRNAYGKKLRELISTGFAMEAVVEMHDVDAFAERVAAYPAVTIIRHCAQQPPMVATTTADFDEVAAKAVVRWSQQNRDVRRPGTAAGSNGRGAFAPLVHRRSVLAHRVSRATSAPRTSRRHFPSDRERRNSRGHRSRNRG